MAALNQYQVRHWRCKGQKCWKQLRSSITCRDKKSIKTVWVCTFLSLEIRARVAQRWNHSPPTNVARVQIPASTPYVGWVCCLFSPLPRRFFSGYSGFPLYSKTNISKFQFDQKSDRQRSTMWLCYLQIFIYLFTQRISHHFCFCWWVSSWKRL